MAKIVLTGAIVLSVGILSVVKTITPQKEATPTLTEKIVVNNNLATLETAD